jgi:hypothetical protein
MARISRTVLRRTDAEPFGRRYGVGERKDEPVEIPGFGQEHQAEEHHGDHP